MYRLRNSFVDFSTTEGNNIVKPFGNKPLLAINSLYNKNG